MRSRYELTPELRRHGFESATIEARFNGGRCGLCHESIHTGRGTQIVKFRGRGWCHMACTTAVTSAEYALAHALPRLDAGDDSRFQRAIAEAEAATLAKFGITFDPRWL